MIFLIPDKGVRIPHKQNKQREKELDWEYLDFLASQPKRKVKK